LAMCGGSGKNEQACADACEGLLYHYFTEHCGDNCQSPLTLPEIGIDAGNFFASAAWCIARLRARSAVPEYEYRIVEALSTLARARAAIEGHTQVQRHHLQIIRHIVASACKANLRATMAIALEHAPVTTTELQRLLNCTRDTALKYMEELAKTAVFRMTKGKPPNQPSILDLSENAVHLKWCRQPSSTISGECVQDAEES